MDELIKFTCDSCGMKAQMSKKHAGKKGRCPKCKNICIIPKEEYVFDPGKDFKELGIKNEN